MPKNHIYLYNIFHVRPRCSISYDKCMDSDKFKPWCFANLRCCACGFNTPYVGLVGTCCNCKHNRCKDCEEVEYIPGIQCWACEEEIYGIDYSKNCGKCGYEVDVTCMLKWYQFFDEVEGDEVDMEELWMKWKRENRRAVERKNGAVRMCVEVDVV